MLSLHCLNLDVTNDFCQLVEFGNIDRLVAVLLLELVPALQIALDVFSRGLSIHDVIKPARC